MQKIKDKFLIARVPKEVFLEFKKKANAEGKTPSEKLRQLVDKYLK